MKTNVFFKAMCVGIVMMVSVSVANAQNYVTNDVMEGEKVVTRFVYKKQSGLHYYIKSDFTYDQENRLATKETFLWNTRKQEWVPRRRIHYSYTETEIIITGDEWNKRTGAYKEGTQRSMYDIRKVGLPIAQLTSKQKANTSME